MGKTILYRGECRAAATSKMERFVVIVNGWKPLNIITKQSILDLAQALDPPLVVGAINRYVRYSIWIKKG